MKTRIVAVNGSAGAFVSILATQITRRVEILEDASANGGTKQGLEYQYDDGQVPPFTAIYSVDPADEPIVLGDPVPEVRGAGPVVGVPVQSSGGYTVPATKLVNVRSLSVTATALRVTEYD